MGHRNAGQQRCFPEVISAAITHTKYVIARWDKRSVYNLAALLPIPPVPVLPLFISATSGLIHMFSMRLAFPAVIVVGLAVPATRQEQR